MEADLADTLTSDTVAISVATASASVSGGATTREGGIKGAAPTFSVEGLGTKTLDSGFSSDFGGVDGDAWDCVLTAGELVVDEAFAGVKEGISGLKLLAP